MNELLITIMLVIPAPVHFIDWTINEVPTQIQLSRVLKLLRVTIDVTQY